MKWVQIMFLILVVTVFLIFYIIIIQNKPNCENYKNYTVQQGDTLWSIAKKVNTKKDIKHVVYVIKKDNNITDCSTLQIGQLIKLREEY